MKKQYKKTQLIGGFWNKYAEMDYYVRSLASIHRKHAYAHVYAYLMNHIYYNGTCSIQFETGRTINNTNEWEIIHLISKRIKNEETVSI